MVIASGYAFASLGPFISGIALVAMLVFALAGLAVLLYLADLPGRIAAGRGHPQAAAVRVAGWLGLPTGVLWVLAMVWAYAGSTARGDSNRQLNELEAAVTRLENSHAGGRA
ncbi:Inner membrane protein YiaW [Botrimarina colliarenosi]|uniref:Inner membrane protein YiaW n=1 Tax=Botrimarina colliarenosi TaxID=2528001 RepID=A0A5C6AHQ5_9BACT|nr:DUF3302 domain-containing protein [Botrimarina colliarenosi]TWT97743.1 Inner membrane protein YiaW [Botrimarina colliarenosi]